MNIKDAKNIELVAFLSNLGYEPTFFKKGNEAWYFSPLRTENTPSFKVDLKTNKWRDFGIDIGGDILNFIIEYKKTNTKGALEFLSTQKFAGNNNSPLSKVAIIDKRVPQIQIIKVIPISNQGIINYITKRCIPMKLASYYCQEVHYSCREINYYAVGFKNDQGGYELRTANFKGKTSDSYTTINVPDSTQLDIFEGFFDFLSSLTFSESLKPKNSTLILNSTNKISLRRIGELQTIFDQNEQLNLFLDNDDKSRTGQNTALEIKKYHPNVKDCSYVYVGYKDFNEFLQNNNQK